MTARATPVATPICSKSWHHKVRREHSALYFLGTIITKLIFFHNSITTCWSNNIPEEPCISLHVLADSLLGSNHGQEEPVRKVEQFKEKEPQYEVHSCADASLMMKLLEVNEAPMLSFAMSESCKRHYSHLQIFPKYEFSCWYFTWTARIWSISCSIEWFL